MKQILITGSWRYIRADVERDVRAAVRDILNRGDAIITGGALGVDEWATDAVL
jgi:predicted Rossmann fold nucleotide-binding protein DprA/Smf involved in DNA uptake